MRQFYGTLAKALEAEGVAVSVVTLDADQTLARVEADGGHHIVHHARIRHPRVLNAGKAYIEPFFTLDPWGFRLFSSIAAAPFLPDPDPVWRELMTPSPDHRLPARYERMLRDYL